MRTSTAALSLRVRQIEQRAFEKVQKVVISRIVAAQAQASRGAAVALA